MKYRQRSFFWRLLYAFLICSLVPFCLLVVLYGSASTRVLESAYRGRTEDSVNSAASLVTQLLEEASRLCEKIAASEPVIQYLLSDEKDSWLLSEVNRLFSSTLNSDYWIPYVLPFDGLNPIFRFQMPDEYDLSLYSRWGLLGKLNREDILSNSKTVFFGQPHPNSGMQVSLAVGSIARLDEKILGYIVLDINRQLFVERIGSVASAGGALTGLSLIDSSGCILYNMTDPYLESGFISQRQNPHMFVSRATLPGGLILVGEYPVGVARDQLTRTAGMILVIAGISFLLSFVLAILFSGSIASPIHSLTVTMEHVSQGQLDARCPEVFGRDSGDELAVLIHRFNAMIDQVNSLVLNRVAQERDLRRAETQALQAQINPHFLYNTLNSIRSMARLEGSTQIAEMTWSLARILREGSFPGGSFSTVSESLSIARDYFLIDSCRWPDRFKLTESVDPLILDAQIPRLIIQPVVENALVHGLEEKKGSGELHITGTLSAGDVILCVSDTGLGIDPNRLSYIRTRLAEAGERPVESSLNESTDSHLNTKRSSSERAGIALVNIHRRLSLIYGQPYGLSIVSTVGVGTEVSISFPYHKKETVYD